RNTTVWTLDAKKWAFLFLALILGPCLIANVIFKDHWGRARPREIVEFGGTRHFSPALVPQEVVKKNESFISGDAAFGFYLPSFAYVVPMVSRKRNLSRRVFWSCMGVGSLFGLSRLAMGAHFLSDIIYAMVFMLVASAALHALMFGRKETSTRWHNWFFHDNP
ncbi:MAG TPA: phosphatase PAP2 family protein, partial [Alphaproteobacteria bacterium]|nr:phosphatase PAP2 family protein [Alphaproteobacteria bacterium]